MPETRFTAIVEKEGNLYVALCPELDVASQGHTIEEARANLKEAVELFLECADPAEIETLYLLGNPANAEHLRRSIAEARAGKAEERELFEA